MLIAMSAPEPRIFCAHLHRLSVLGVPRKAAFSESDNTRNLPSLIDEMAYITTKNASSSVIRSP